MPSEPRFKDSREVFGTKKICTIVRHSPSENLKANRLREETLFRYPIRSEKWHYHHLGIDEPSYAFGVER